MPANRTGSNPFQGLLARKGSSYQTSPVILHLKKQQGGIAMKVLRCTLIHRMKLFMIAISCMVMAICVRFSYGVETLITSKVTEIAGIPEYTGKGEVYIERGKDFKTLKINANGRVEIIKGRVCYFCLETIRIAPQLIVSISIFEDTEYKKPEGVPFKVTSLELVDFTALFTPTAPITKFIISGPEGATLKKVGKGFLLLEGEAWFIQNKERSAVIYGILLNAETEKPVINATVILIPEDIFDTIRSGGGFVETKEGEFYAHHKGKWIKATIAKTKTANSGMFIFSEIPAGMYALGVKTENPPAFGLRGIPVAVKEKLSKATPLLVDVKEDTDIVGFGKILMFFTPLNK